MQIARAIPQGVDRFSIQLHPADLGMVEIRLEFAEEGRMSALITVERPETLELLQRDSRSLERTLSNAGLSLENGGLSFSLKQEQHQQEQGFNAPSHQQSQAFSNDHGRNGGGDESPDQKPILVSPQRLLDIRT
jgi:flagellar hook-length control protein FliK